MRSVTLQTDLNPIIDEGAPSSTGGIINAAAVCDILGIEFKLHPPREHYEHGWGEQCHDPRPILASWTLTVMDRYSNPFALTFDLVQGESPLIIGLDVTEYADILNRELPSCITIQRPTDIQTLSMYAYVKSEHTNDKARRLRMEIIPHGRSSLSTLMANISTLGSRKPLAFSKKLHRFTHAPATEIKEICSKAGILNKRLSQAIDTVDRECEVCTRNGRPASHPRVSHHSRTSTPRSIRSFRSTPHIARSEAHAIYS